MKYLCLAYGNEEDWKALTDQEREAFLAQDAVIRDRGALTGAVTTEVTTVRAWTGTPETLPQPFASAPRHLAGFSILEAENLEEAVRLVAGTPCARAKGAIEIRPILMTNAPELRSRNTGAVIPDL